MIFTTIENLLLILKNASFWVMDGTFKPCPTLFNKLFVIHGSVERGDNRIVVLLVYALMTSRDEDLYIQLFENINNFVEELIRIEDSEDRDRWKDVVEAAKVLNGL